MDSSQLKDDLTVIGSRCKCSFKNCDFVAYIFVLYGHINDPIPNYKMTFFSSAMRLQSSHNTNTTLLALTTFSFFF